jgi:hypothetical protein
MTRTLWFALCCMLAAAASVSSAEVQPVQSLPPPPGTVASPSDAPSPPNTVEPGKSAEFAPLQAPQQAPMKGNVQTPLQAPVQTSQYMTRTVMVPQTTYKTFTVPDVVCKPEVRQQTVSVCRMVPETQMVNHVETVMVPERRTATQPYTVCRMEYQTVQKPVTVMVPQMETRQGVRTVCKPVAVQETRTVCKDMGGWNTRSYVDCYGCMHTCQAWAPNVVTEQVPITVYRPQMVQEAFTYEVVVCRPEQRMVTEQFAKPVYETQTREVSYIVPVAKQVQRQVPQTTLRPVVENKTVNYTVMVPQRVERQVTVPVCTMVAKQVAVAVPPCGPCGPGGACGW